MKLKCIGGSHDGKYIDIHDDCKVGDATRVMIEPTLKAIDELPKSYEEIRDTITVEYSIYIVHRLLYKEKTDELNQLFLAPEGWSFLQALRHQFSK